jgi:hypothetical protein
MKPTRYEALRSAMREELTDEEYDKIMSRAREIRDGNY